MLYDKKIKIFTLFALALFSFFACQKKADSPANSAGKSQPKPSIFEPLDPKKTGLAFSNRLPEDTAGMNIIQYLYYYNGGGVALGDVVGDSLPDVFLTSNWGPCRLFENLGGLRFRDVSEKAGIAGPASARKTGATMADVNGDGLLDIYLSCVGDYKIWKGRNQLFINLGDGRFAEKAADFGLDVVGFCTQSAFFDADADGDLDCFVLRHSVKSPAEYRPAEATRQPDRLSSDLFFENKNGRFIDRTASAGIRDGQTGYGLGLAVGDLNSDGLADLFVANDFHENDFIYLNRGGLRFDEISKNALAHSSNFSMGCDLADLSGDGLLDIVSLDMRPFSEPILKASAGPEPLEIFNFKLGYGYGAQFPRNAFQLNRGNVFAENEPFFSEIGQFSGISATDWSWSPLAADFDGDGRRDLFVSNGIRRRPNDLDFLKFSADQNVQKKATDRALFERMPDGATANVFFKNEGDLTFSRLEIGEKNCTNGAAWADLDGDGDLDLVLNKLDAPAEILKNLAADRGAKFLKIRAVGASKNTRGIGATVTIFEKGESQKAEIQATRGFQSSSEMIAHFGLKNGLADSLEIRWPSGKTQVLRGVSAGKEIVFFEKNASKKPHSSGFEKAEKGQNAPVFEPFDPKIDWQHVENKSGDTEREKLLLWSQGAFGPKILAADFDNNGEQDLAVAARDLTIFFAEKGRFRAEKIAAFSAENGGPSAAEASAGEEATAFSTADFDGDGDSDLVVGRGGNEFSDAKRPAAELFLNDGAGHFSISKTAFPTSADNAATILAADFDADGDTDLFIGSRSVVGRYGLDPTHFLLKNDGKGAFSRVDEQLAPDLKNFGMLSAAAFSDFDGDGKLDLLAVGEWSSPAVFFQKSDGHFEKKEVEKSSGLWQSLAVADFDADGDQDFLAGNFGLNSSLEKAADGPLEMAVGDLDANGATEPVVSYFRDGERWPFSWKDDLAAQMPLLKKDFVEYRKFANSPFSAVFSKKMIEKAAFRQAETLETSFFENLGGGKFARRAMPREAQFSSAMAFLTSDFDGDGKMDALAAGNFFETQPSVGRLDGSLGEFFRGDGRGGFEFLEPRKSGFALRGEVRDLAFFEFKKQKIVVAAVNGGRLRFFKIR